MGDMGKESRGRYSGDKSCMVGVRFSEEFLADVKEASESIMLSTSAFIRMVVFKEIKRMKENGEI